MVTIQKMAVILGIVAGVFSICLWVALSFINPYSNANEIDPIVNTFLMLCLPACIALYSSLHSKKMAMLVAFIWSLPFSLYLAMTPGIFALFGVTSFLYLLSFLIMLLRK